MSGVPLQYVPVQMMAGTGITDTPSSIHPAAWGFLAVSVLALLLVIYMVYIDRPKSAPTPAGPPPAPPAATVASSQQKVHVTPTEVLLFMRKTKVDSSTQAKLRDLWTKLQGRVAAAGAKQVRLHLATENKRLLDEATPEAKLFIENLEKYIKNIPAFKEKLEKVDHTGVLIIHVTENLPSVYTRSEFTEDTLWNFILTGQ
jgi:hypothetical protein